MTSKTEVIVIGAVSVVCVAQPSALALVMRCSCWKLTALLAVLPMAFNGRVTTSVDHRSGAVWAGGPANPLAQILRALDEPWR